MTIEQTIKNVEMFGFIFICIGILLISFHIYLKNNKLI